METNTLILTGDGYGLAIAPEAEAQKAELLKHSALIEEVNDAAAAEAGRGQLRKLAAMRNLVEKSRKLVKEPVLKIGKDIDAKAAEFLAELASEEKRLDGLIGDYATRVEQERQAAERERQRIEREAEAKRQEAERQRIAEEAAAAKALADAEAARIASEKALEEADEDDIDAQVAAAAAIDAANAARAKQEAEAKAAQEAEAKRRLEAEQLAAESRRNDAVASQRTAGVKFRPDFEVENVHELYAVFPELVTLTPRRMEILERINSYMERNGGQLPTVPGLLITKKAVVATR